MKMRDNAVKEKTAVPGYKEQAEKKDYLLKSEGKNSEKRDGRIFKLETTSRLTLVYTNVAG
jgi:hypothetical protein